MPVFPCFSGGDASSRALLGYRRVYQDALEEGTHARHAETHATPFARAARTPPTRCVCLALRPVSRSPRGAGVTSCVGYAALLGSERVARPDVRARLVGAGVASVDVGRA